LIAVLYIAVKFLAYICWVYYGLQLFRPDQYFSTALAMGYGFFRLLLGFFFGVVIFFLLERFPDAINTHHAQSVLAYLLIYIPIRWIEWTIMAAMLNPSRATFNHAITGVDNADRLWRAGGIAISCLADIPLIIFFGGVLPTGRILC